MTYDWEKHEAEIDAALVKYSAFRSKLDTALGIVPADVREHDNDSMELNDLMVHVTETSCLIKRVGQQPTECGGLPSDFHDFYRWDDGVQVVIAPNKEKRDAYLFLFPEAEAID